MTSDKFISIRYKIVFLMVIVSIFVVSVASLLFYKNEIELLENSAIESGQMQASIIGASLQSAIIFDDALSAKDTLSLFSNNEQVRYAAVLLTNGVVFADYQGGRSQQSIEKQSSLNPAKHTQYLKETTPNYIAFGHDYLEITQLVSDQGIPIAYLYICLSLDKVKQQQKYYQKILLYVMLFSVVFAVTNVFILFFHWEVIRDKI